MDDLLKQYNESISDVGGLKKMVKKKLNDYETKVRDSKKPTREPQEDGWITVHHKGGRDHIKRRSKKKKKEADKLVNFYAFEVKESKLKKYKQLLEKFEDDKKKVATMRHQRKFKLN